MYMYMYITGNYSKAVEWDSLESPFTFDVVFKTTFTAYIEDLLYNYKDTLNKRLPLSIKVLQTDHIQDIVRYSYRTLIGVHEMHGRMHPN